MKRGKRWMNDDSNAHVYGICIRYIDSDIWCIWYMREPAICTFANSFHPFQWPSIRIHKSQLLVLCGYVISECRSTLCSLIWPIQIDLDIPSYHAEFMTVDAKMAFKVYTIFQSAFLCSSTHAFCFTRLHRSQVLHTHTYTYIVEWTIK